MNAPAAQAAKRAGEESVPRPPLPSRRPWTGRRMVDVAMRGLVSAGGVTVILLILAILVVITAEVVPLWRAPVLRAGHPVQAGKQPLMACEDEYRRTALVFEARGPVFYSLTDGQVLEAAPLAELRGAQVTACAPLRCETVSESAAPRAPGGRWFLGLSDGRVLSLAVNWGGTKEGRTVRPSAQASECLPASERPAPIQTLACAATDKGAPVVVAVTGPQTLALITFEEGENMLTGEKVESADATPVRLESEREITALALGYEGDQLFAGTRQGELLWFDLRGAGKSRPAQSASLGTPVTALTFLTGGRTVVAGTAEGSVSTWQLTNRLSQSGEAMGLRLGKVYDFPALSEAVACVGTSTRNRAFVVAGTHGSVGLYYGTRGERDLAFTVPDGEPVSIQFSPKSDGLLAATGAGELVPWSLDMPHPEVSLRGLFTAVHYEGYEGPAHVWSTNNPAGAEPKFGLTILLFGTLKGAVYSLLFAVPVALLAALYTSQFMHPKIKAVVKPTVEVMASLPSVVLGFIGALWLAPALAPVLPGVFLAPPVTGATILAALALWQTLPRGLRHRLHAGSEVLLLVPVVLLGVWLSFVAGHAVEGWFFHGDFRGWLHTALHTRYDQKNSVVVGFTMGFAVIPIIFTIAEDSLSNVPRHLAAGALALGATPWQTAIRVVLPTASPGIFSALMIGFGRAIGETMIILMATGGTAIMDWNPFNGFRALSANMATELPEADHGGTLYRVLFLSAMLLFLLTFLVNTLAEVVRLHLRRRYRAI